MNALSQPQARRTVACWLIVMAAWLIFGARGVVWIIDVVAEGAVR